MSLKYCENVSAWLRVDKKTPNNER